MRQATYMSPLGNMRLVFEGNVLLGLWFEDQAHFARGYDLAKITNEQTLFSVQVAEWLDAYFAGDKPNPNQINICPQVSMYQFAILNQLQEVPYAQTCTYQALADQVAQKQGKLRGSARATGWAVGRNPIAILIPCHRVLGSKGNLIGYAGGLERKRILLQIEGINII